MRAISIRQPFASLTAAGIRDLDVSNRDTKYRGRVLIHASSRRVGKDCGKDMSVDQYCRLRNAQALGVIPYDEEVPLSSIIGFAELTFLPTKSQIDITKAKEYEKFHVSLAQEPVPSQNIE